MSDGACNEDSLTCPDQGSSNADAKTPTAFSYVLDVACAANEASEKVLLANKKVAYITEAARKACQQAKELEHLSDCLLATAASVSTMVMKASSYRDFREAFDSEDGSSRIDFETFLEIVSPSVSGPPRQDTRCKKQNLSPIQAREYSHNEHHSTVDPEWNTSSTSGKRDSIGSGVRRHSTSSRNSSTKAMISDDKQKYSKEKFPPLKTPLEYRDNLAASFDSTSTITPLWEDRYMPAPQKDRPRSNSLPNTDNWISKKALKQFQIKMQNIEGDIVADETEVIELDGSREHHKKKAQSHKNGTRHKTKHEKRAPHFAYESDSDLSTDSEVEVILQQKPQPIRRLKKERLDDVDGCRLSIPKRENRMVSPLLSDTEKGLYSVSGDESPVPPESPRASVQKQRYQPQC